MHDCIVMFELADGAPFHVELVGCFFLSVGSEFLERLAMEALCTAGLQDFSVLLVLLAVGFPCLRPAKIKSGMPIREFHLLP